MTQNVKPIDSAGGGGSQAPKLTTKQRRAIAAILSSRTYDEAMTTARISRQTFYNWMKQPHFKAELDRQLNELTDGAFNQLKNAAGDAVDTLRTLLNSESENVRLRASQAIVDYVIKARELGDISARLDEIEKTIAAAGK